VYSHPWITSDTSYLYTLFPRWLGHMIFYCVSALTSQPGAPVYEKHIPTMVVGNALSISHHQYEN